MKRGKGVLYLSASLSDPASSSFTSVSLPSRWNLFFSSTDERVLRREGEVFKVESTFFSWRVERLNRYNLSVLRSSSRDFGTYSVVEPVTDVGEVLSEPWSLSCSLAVPSSLISLSLFWTTKELLVIFFFTETLTSLKELLSYCFIISIWIHSRHE